MNGTRPLLTLAHSPDPDDAFMWWPITGKVGVSSGAGDSPCSGLKAGSNMPPILESAPLDTGRFQYRAVPADIEVLNRRAADVGDLDITAISFRNYCEIKERYALTACGSSFGDGFGPKLVCRADCAGGLESFANSKMRIAIPGRRTTAFLVLAQAMMKNGGSRVRQLLAPEAGVFVEKRFEEIIPAVARGEFDAGLVIHEGQLLFEQAGLRLVVDVGAWWKQETGLPLPLGANAIRRDLDVRFGAGTMLEVAATLRRSIDYALTHRWESLEYTMPFALANATRSGEASGEAPTIERVDRYVSMYVNEWTVDMGRAGVEAVRRLLTQGHELGLCASPGGIDVVGLR